MKSIPQSRQYTEDKAASERFSKTQSSHQNIENNFSKDDESMNKAKRLLASYDPNDVDNNNDNNNNINNNNYSTSSLSGSRPLSPSSPITIPSMTGFGLNHQETSDFSSRFSTTSSSASSRVSSPKPPLLQSGTSSIYSTLLSAQKPSAQVHSSAVHYQDTYKNQLEDKKKMYQERLNTLTRKKSKISDPAGGGGASIVSG